MSVQIFSLQDLRCFPSDSGGVPIYANFTDAGWGVLHEPSHEEFDEVYNEFFRLRWDFYWHKHIASPHPQQPVAKGFTTRIAQNKKQGTEFRLFYSLRPHWIHEAMQHAGRITRPYQVRDDMYQDVLRMTVKQQCELLQNIPYKLRSDPRECLSSHLQNRLWPMDVKNEYEKCGYSFVRLLSSMLELREQYRMNCNNAIAPLVEDFMILWWSKKWLLLPQMNAGGLQFNRSSKFGFPLEAIHWCGFLADTGEQAYFSKLCKSMESNGVLVKPKGNDTTRRMARLLMMSSTLRADGQLSRQYIEEICSRSFKEKVGFKLKRGLTALWMVENPGQTYQWTAPKHDHERRLRQIFSTPDERLETWIEIWAKFLASREDEVANITVQLHRSRWWFKFLHNHPNPPKTPEAVSRKDHIRSVEGSGRFWDYMRDTEDSVYARNDGVRILQRFFEWYRAHYNEAITNPVTDIDKLPVDKSNIKTFREAIPVKVIEGLKRLIVECNPDGSFRWSDWVQSIPGDVVTVVDAEHQITTKTWQPVRAAVIYIMLVFPLRTVQVRWLDSGERDELIYNFGSAHHVQNRVTGPAGAIAGRTEGVLQPAWADRNVLEFQVNSNKTAIPNSERSHYTIPFVPEDIMFVLREVLRWQQRYGASPTTLVSAADDPLEHAKSRTAANKTLNVCALFRDAARMDGRLFPVADKRMVSFYRALCSEYDQRNSEIEGATRLTKRSDSNGVEPLYDKHSLRVSGVTALIDAGVPLGIVASVTGHSSIAMTLYYYKAGLKTFRESLINFYERLKTDPNQAETIDLLQSVEEVRDSLIANSEDGFKAINQHDSSLWTVNVDGICPGTRCSEGLCLDGGGFGPVPESRCPLCRFWLTGPSFLAGQVIRFNNLVYTLHQLAMKEKRLNEQRLDAISKSEHGIIRRVDYETEMLQRRTTAAVSELAARHRKINESKAVMTRPQTSGIVHTLVGSQDALQHLQVETEQVHFFDLLDRVTQAAELLPLSSDETFEHAVRHKHELLFHLLVDNNIPNFLLTLDTPTALKVGNLMSDMILRHVPSKGNNDEASELTLLLGGKTPLDKYQAVAVGLRRLAESTSKLA